MVVAMARNGTGLRHPGRRDRGRSGSPGRRRSPTGLYLGGYGPEDANRDIGDSAITETAGPGRLRHGGGPGHRPLRRRHRRRRARHHAAHVRDHAGRARALRQVPVLDFRGTPLGIDVTAVVRTGILPQINTGMAGKVAGHRSGRRRTGHPACRVFPKALTALAAGPADLALED